jgi:hypothetical protein
MGMTLADLHDHDGYAARKLPDGTITSAETSEFVAYVAACDCGADDEWWGATEYPPTDEGSAAALAEWERIHARPLLQTTEPHGLDDDISELLDRLGRLATERPAAVLPALRRVELQADQLLSVAVREARAGGNSWATIGAALGMTKQSAQQRFRNA